MLAADAGGGLIVGAYALCYSSALSKATREDEDERITFPRSFNGF